MSVWVTNLKEPLASHRMMVRKSRRSHVEAFILLVSW